MERNSAAYVFDVSFTLTEAGLAAAPGARPRSARSTRRSRTRAQSASWRCAARSPCQLAVRGQRGGLVLYGPGACSATNTLAWLLTPTALRPVLCMRYNLHAPERKAVRQAWAGPSPACTSRSLQCCRRRAAAHGASAGAAPGHLQRLPAHHLHPRLQAGAWRSSGCCLSTWRCCARLGRSAGRTTRWPPLAP